MKTIIAPIPTSDDWIGIDYNCDDTPNLTYMAFWLNVTGYGDDINPYGIRGFGNTPTSAIMALVIQTNLMYPIIAQRKSTSLCNTKDITATV
jgi:hypothetical protein